jgi:hypothetical protein
MLTLRTPRQAPRAITDQRRSHLLLNCGWRGDGAAGRRAALSHRPSCSTIFASNFSGSDTRLNSAACAWKSVRAGESIHAARRSNNTRSHSPGANGGDVRAAAVSSDAWCRGLRARVRARRVMVVRTVCIAEAFGAHRSGTGARQMFVASF